MMDILLRTQGLTDYALASAGGRVVGHSKLAGPLPVWYRAWRVLAPAFAGPHPLLPHLDKVRCCRTASYCQMICSQQIRLAEPCCCASVSYSAS